MNEKERIKKGWTFASIGALLLLFGMFLYMTTYPSIAWIMSHSLEEYLSRAYQSIFLFAVPAVIGVIINVYGLYLIFVKKVKSEEEGGTDSI